MVLGERVAHQLKMMFQEIAERVGFEIDTQEVLDDHVQIFIWDSPRYSPAQVVQRLKVFRPGWFFRSFRK
jgi:REP element-mobilizing transposase RayT